jgi:hypothetical protein
LNIKEIENKNAVALAEKSQLALSTATKKFELDLEGRDEELRRVTDGMRDVRETFGEFGEFGVGIPGQDKVDGDQEVGM